MHVKNPVGDFSPTGFVEQPFLRIERIFLIVALRRKQPAKAVSLLKLEPKVSSFPVLEAHVASSTNATAKRLFISSIVKKL